MTKGLFVNTTECYFATKTRSSCDEQIPGIVIDNTTQISIVNMEEIASGYSGSDTPSRTSTRWQ